MILEIILAVVFIVFLIMISIVVINAAEGSETETTITNSFNTYNYNTYPARTQTQYTTLSAKPYIVDNDYERNYYLIDDTDYFNDGRHYDSDNRYLSYDSSSRLRVSEGLFGNDINNYEVYVRNKDYTGGYFTVNFYFEDYYGNVDFEVMKHYIDPREENRFVFKDISPNRYDYRRWWYDVESLTTIKTEIN